MPIREPVHIRGEKTRGSEAYYISTNSESEGPLTRSELIRRLKHYGSYRPTYDHVPSSVQAKVGRLFHGKY